MSDNQSKPVVCPTCGGPLPDAEPGKTVTCAHCKTTSAIPAAPPSPKADSFVMIQASTVTANRIVGHDLIETHYHGAEAPLPAEALAAPASGGFVCPNCQAAVAVKKTTPGKKYLCMGCKIFSQVSADGTRLEAAVVSSEDIGGKGKGVNIKTGGDLTTGGDVIGRDKIK